MLSGKSKILLVMECKLIITMLLSLSLFCQHPTENKPDITDWLIGTWYSEYDKFNEGYQSWTFDATSHSRTVYDENYVITYRDVELNWYIDYSKENPVISEPASGLGTVVWEIKVINNSGFENDEFWYRSIYAKQEWVSFKRTKPTIITNAFTVSDIDGNVYHTVKIGNQIWTVENLRTTKYNDGTPIPFVPYNETWDYTKTPKYCYYNNKTIDEDSTEYGLLYNWYVINPANPKQLAPTGWHVPSDTEWTILQNYLIANGYNYDRTTTGNKIGKSMAARYGWDNATDSSGQIGYSSYPFRNSSGFSGLPVGFRDYDGVFKGRGKECLWWSNTEIDSSQAYSRYLCYKYTNLVRFEGGNKSMGFPIRLIMDSN